MEVICLIENYAEDPQLESEHGLSLFIDNGVFKILFDAGASGKIVDNARLLGVELEKVDLVIISHGHYDHGGGLEAFFKVNKKARAYICQGADKKHVRIVNDTIKDIGLDEKVLKKYRERITFLDDFTQLRDNLYLITSISHSHEVPEGNKLLYEGEDFVPDSFSHELIMVLKLEPGLVVFTGCSHHGILNILDAVVEHFPGVPILAVFGGLHLTIPPHDTVVDPATLEEIAENLLGYPIQKIYTNHCTGTEGYDFLKKYLGDDIQYFATGSKVTIK